MGCTSCGLQSWHCPKNRRGNSLKVRVGTGIPLSFPRAWVVSGFILCHVPALLPRALGFGVPGGPVALRGGTGSPRAARCGVGKAGVGPAWLGSRCWAGRRRLRASAVSHRAASPAVCPGGGPGLAPPVTGFGGSPALGSACGTPEPPVPVMGVAGSVPQPQPLNFWGT